MRKITRRTILRKCMLLGMGFLGADWGWSKQPYSGRRLVILHTNDTHPRLTLGVTERRFSIGEELLLARYEMIQQIRAEGIPVLLLDSGDFTGSYFNRKSKEMPAEWKAMQIMGYDALALGDVDLLVGIDTFALHWEKVGIPLLLCNYRFEGTTLEKWVSPYCMLDKGNIRIGIIGVGLQLSNRLPESIFSGMLWEDPVKSVNECVKQLQKRGCELIICLSHLGDQSSTEIFHDFRLAEENVGIDLIIGAHSHRLYEKPRKFTNKIGGITVVNQIGWGGGYLGRLDVFFPKKGTDKTLKASRLIIEKKIAE